LGMLTRVKPEQSISLRCNERTAAEGGHEAIGWQVAIQVAIRGIADMAGKAESVEADLRNMSGDICWDAQRRVLHLWITRQSFLSASLPGRSITVLVVVAVYGCRERQCTAHLDATVRLLRDTYCNAQHPGLLGTLESAF
jgi:hypothetical protein